MTALHSPGPEDVPDAEADAVHANRTPTRTPVHPSWLCSDCVLEKRTDCATADPEYVEGASRCWEPLVHGQDTRLPLEAEDTTAQATWGEGEHSNGMECALCEGVCDFLHTAPHTITVQPGDVAAALAGGLEYSDRVQADTVVHTPEDSVIERLLSAPLPPGGTVTYEFADEVTLGLDKALAMGLAEARPYVYATVRENLRRVDLAQVEGKTFDEVAEMTVHSHWPVSDCSLTEEQEGIMQRVLEDHTPPGTPFPVVSWLCWRAFRRGCAAGALVTLGVFGAWAAGDRAWQSWRDA